MKFEGNVKNVIIINAKTITFKELLYLIVQN